MAGSMHFHSPPGPGEVEVLAEFLQWFEMEQRASTPGLSQVSSSVRHPSDHLNFTERLQSFILQLCKLSHLSLLPAILIYFSGLMLVSSHPFSKL